MKTLFFPRVPIVPGTFVKSWQKLALVALALGVNPLAASAAPVIGSGNVTSEKRDVSGFHAVDLASFGNVVVTQGDSEGLTIQGEDNLVPLIETKVDDQGVLHLTMKPNAGGVRTTKPLVFNLAAKTLDHLMVAGSGNIESKTLTVKDALDVLVRGSGNVKVGALSAASLKIDLQGSGNINVAGNVDRSEVTLAGSGDFDAGELKTKTTNIQLSGSGDCEVWATEQLKADVRGSGDVSYYGKPTVDKHVAGSGSVEALGTKGQ